MKRVSIPLELAPLEYASDAFEPLGEAADAADLTVGVTQLPALSIAPGAPADAGIPILFAVQRGRQQPYLLVLNVPFDALDSTPAEDLRALAFMTILIEVDRCIRSAHNFHEWADSRHYSTDSRAAEHVFRATEAMVTGFITYLSAENLAPLVNAAFECAESLRQGDGALLGDLLSEAAEEFSSEMFDMEERLVQEAQECGNLDCPVHGPILRIMGGDNRTPPKEPPPDSGRGPSLN